MTTSRLQLLITHDTRDPMTLTPVSSRLHPQFVCEFTCLCRTYRCSSLAVTMVQLLPISDLRIHCRRQCYSDILKIIDSKMQTGEGMCQRQTSFVSALTSRRVSLRRSITVLYVVYPEFFFCFINKQQTISLKRVGRYPLLYLAINRVQSTHRAQHYQYISRAMSTW